MDTYFLCIETSSKVCSAALCNEDRIIVQDSYEPNSHSKYLTVFIEKLLENLQDKKQQLRAIAVSEGPGSYTGLRIGVSAAKGLAYSLDLPMIAVGTMDIMVRAFLDQNKEITDFDLIIPMIDARRMEVYTATFDKNANKISQVTNLILNQDSFKDLIDKQKTVFIGDGAEKFSKLVRHPNAYFVPDIFPHAKYMFELAKQKYEQQDFADVAYFEPFYLKPFIPTTKPKPLLQ